MTTPAAVPKFEGFHDLQSLQEFLNKVENFCAAVDIPTGAHVRRVIATALDRSTKLWYHFSGPFESWDPFTEGFKKELAPVDEKFCLKQELAATETHTKRSLSMSSPPTTE